VTSNHLTIAEARRIALAAQGFGAPRRTESPAVEHIRSIVRRLGVLQIDLVNVLVPAHYQVIFSRLGAYPRRCLSEALYCSEFTEQWAHEACFIPAETWPLLRFRMDNHRVRPWGGEKILARNAAYVEWVLNEVRRRGPLAASDLPVPDGVDRRIPGAWFSSVPRAALEAFFGRGVLAVTGRLENGARLYDLAERAIPPCHYNRQVPKPEALRELMLRAAAASGIGTAADLADYFRLRVTEARPVLESLASTGDLLHARVEGWREPVYLHPAAALPNRIQAAALLAPFDPLIWYRPRTARLFGFDYRFEIFVPPEKRKWGAYVLPFLTGERLVARVALKADRPAAALLVEAAFPEAGEDPAETAALLAAELRAEAAWLNLGCIVVNGRAAFAKQLRRAIDG
jgi:uncharacterized protein YcaQ